jgi:hypothetical protein
MARFNSVSAPVQSQRWLNTRPREVSLGRLRVDLDRLAGGCVSLRKCFRRGLESVPRQSAVTVRETGISLSISRININRLLKVGFCLPDTLAGSLVPVVTTFQVRQVSFRRRLPEIRQARFLLGCKDNMDLACDASHHRVLYRQHVFEFAVVALAPEIGLILRPD